MTLALRGSSDLAIQVLTNVQELAAVRAEVEERAHDLIAQLSITLVPAAMAIRATRHVWTRRGRVRVADLEEEPNDPANLYLSEHGELIIVRSFRFNRRWTPGCTVDGLSYSSEKVLGWLVELAEQATDKIPIEIARIERLKRFMEQLADRL